VEAAGREALGRSMAREAPGSLLARESSGRSPTRGAREDADEMHRAKMLEKMKKKKEKRK
jgi:hypothetical protein